MLSPLNSNEKFLITFFESKKWRIVRHITLVVVLYIILELPEEFSLNTLNALGVLNPTLALVELNKIVWIIYFVCIVIIYFSYQDY